MTKSRETVRRGAGFVQVSTSMEYCDVTYIRGAGNGHICLIDNLNSQFSRAALQQIWYAASGPETPATAFFKFPIT